MPVAFRIAKAADAPPIVALIEAAYRSPATAGQWDSESHLLTGPRTSLSEIRGLIARADSRFILAEDNRRLAGCALIQQTATPAAEGPAYTDTFSVPAAAEGTAARRDQRLAIPPETGAYFGMFAIDPSIRAAGLGKLVLTEAERQAQAIFGATHMVMTVINVRGQLIAWYERRGYRLTGKTIPFPFTETSGETTRDFHLAEMRKDF